MKFLSSKIFNIVAIFCILLAFSGMTTVLADDNGISYYEQADPEGTLPSAAMLKTNQLIIKYNDSVLRGDGLAPSSMENQVRLSSAAGVKMQYVREITGGAHVLRLPSRMSQSAVKSIINQLLELPEVASVEADILMQPSAAPDDPQFTSQWHYAAPTENNYGINASVGWDITTGSASIVVAVIDTGITSHAEFADRTVGGYDFVSNTTMANDGDGRDNDPSDPGDWITIEEATTGYFAGSVEHNSSWHGTHTAGIIGAASNNGVGVAGTNWNSKIQPVRVMGKGGGYLSDIIDAMRWSAGLDVTGVPANTTPAKVLNLSLAGIGGCSSTMQSAIDEILAVGATIVVSAGNNSINTNSYSPANCNGVITVSATDRYGNRATYSNHGSNVEISAPGGSSAGRVLSTWNTGTTVPGNDTYAAISGTSMSAPLVSGVVSLMYSQNPNLTPAEILQAIQSSATPFPAASTCTTAICGSGILNLADGLTYFEYTAVDLLSFTATVKPKAILLNWETANEANNLGFNIYRSRTKDGIKTRLNAQLIPTLVPPGSPFGAVYQYRDATAKPGIQYFYWLEDVELSGRTAIHDPLKAKILTKR